MIELNHLTVAFGRTLALDSIDLSIATGVTGLFGQNGSGKSTLLRVIAGLLRPTNGTVLIDGRASGLRDEQLRARFGYAGHESGLYGRLSLGENLALFGRLYGIAPGRSESILESLDLSDQTNTPVSALSAGKKRLGAVARALLHDPQILLLDEPYANVDDEAADRISNAIRDWAAPEKLAVIATHGAKKVKAYASAGIVLQRGRVVTHGTYKEGAWVR